MDNITFLTEYAAPIIVGICLCVGYILKNLVPEEKVNRFIPLIMGIIGVVVNVWMNMNFAPEILLTGLFSGLASTGMHQAFTKIVNREE